MSTEITDVSGQDVGDLITTAEQLRAYLDSHPVRHAPADDGQCACGWPHVPEALLTAWRESTSFHTQAEHATSILIGALGDILPSDTSDQSSDGATTQLSWRALATKLYKEIDLRDRSIDPRFVTLMRWLIDQDLADVATLAQVTVMHPSYLARLLAVPAPAPVSEGADATAGDAR